MNVVVLECNECGETPNECEFDGSQQEVTWCDERIYDTDVEYIRSDLVTK